MKKLLYTTAIAGLAMTYATVSSAETKVSGNLGLSYFANSDDKASPKSLNGFGKESQINISNSGDLNNGMKYAAGFSLEMDGANGVAVADQQAQQSENVYIDITSGNTTLSVGADHFQNGDIHLTNLVGFGYVNATGASQDAVSVYPTNPSNYGAYGIGLKQATTVGSFGINFTPNATSALSTNDIGDALKTSEVSGTAKSAYEISFIGDLGVKGATIVATKKMQDKMTGPNTRDLDSQRIAAKYSSGPYSIAVDTVKQEDGTVEKTGKSIGVAYSISDKLSIGYTRAEADTTTASTVDEKTDMIAIGYNLGPVSVQAQYKDVESLAGVSGNDGKLFGLYLGTKF